jgi:predicted enzyme involved in methoxymalonyl-ACP biosynthesis
MLFSSCGVLKRKIHHEVMVMVMDGGVEILRYS